MQPIKSVLPFCSALPIQYTLTYCRFMSMFVFHSSLYFETDVVVVDLFYSEMFLFHAERNDFLRGRFLLIATV